MTGSNFFAARQSIIMDIITKRGDDDALKFYKKNALNVPWFFIAIESDAECQCKVQERCGHVPYAHD